MSLPAAMSSVALPSMVLSPMDGFLQMFNNNPYFIGMMMLLLNLGGRFISLEVTKQQEQFLQRPWVRRVLIFTVLFVATRNLWVAFWATLAVILLLGYLFNENSALCIFGSGGQDGATCSEGGSGEKKEDMTPEEKEILHRLSSKAQRYQNIGGSSDEEKKKEKENDVEADKIYMANLKLMK